MTLNQFTQKTLPLDLHVNVVEIRIVHVALVRAGHAGRKRTHFDLLSFRDDPTECLKLNEGVEEIDCPVSQISAYSMSAEVRPTELPHTSRVEPFHAVLIFRGKDRKTGRHLRRRLHSKDAAKPLRLNP